ncbi:MAG: site-specific integrase [Nitrosomonas sp.]|nr:site-specific integrase [Nitrosomonas sp.]
MATYRKIGKNWKVEVCRKGVRRSKTFNTKAECTFWAAEIEQEILAGESGKVPVKKFSDLLRRYADEVSPAKRGCDWEVTRINMICRDEISEVMLSQLKSDKFASWRDRRLRNVSVGTVLREWNLLSHVINVSIKEWGWLKENPLKNVKRPPQPRPRDRLISEDEIQRLLFALGYNYERKPETYSSRVGAALLFAIETAMRAGEIVSLNWDRVNLDKRTALLIETKNGHKREVPLSGEAIRILNQLQTENGSVFNLKSSQIDSLFRKAKKMALIEGLTFHDSRATAITRLSKKVDILTLSRISGHRDLRMLQIYYRESAEEIAKRL